MYKVPFWVAWAAAFLLLGATVFGAHNVATPYQLWNIRNDLTDTFTQTGNIDLAISNPATKPAAYAGGTTYQIGDSVTHTHGATERTYFSLTADNTGNDPTDADTANWAIAWTTAEGWLPIGTSAAPFTGSFIGTGYTISNMVIVRATTDYQGLFGKCTTGTLTGVGLVRGSVSGQIYTGFLAGMSSSAITSCYSTGTVISSSSDCGGLVGKSSGSLTSCYATGAVAGAGSDVGGLAGWTTITSPVTQCYATGTVTSSAGTCLGGLIGISEGTVTLCYSTGAVTGTGTNGFTGGFVGRFNQSSYVISNCYSKGAVSCGSGGTFGGFVGYASNGTLLNCYATGLVTGAEGKGFCGAFGAGGTGTLCYYDTTTSGKSDTVGSTGFATASMVYPYGNTSPEPPDASTYPFYGWNFDAFWCHDNLNRNGGYPILRCFNQFNGEVTQPVWGIYVDSAAADDTGDGLTPVTALKTIDHAYGHAVSDSRTHSVIRVKAGTYRELVTMDIAGTNAYPVTIEPLNPGETVIVNGADILTGWTQCSSDDSGLHGNANYSNIYYKDVTIRATQLFKDGLRLEPSRYPAKTSNDGTIAHTVTDGGPGWCFPTTEVDDTAFYDTGLIGLGTDHFVGSVVTFRHPDNHHVIADVTAFNTGTGLVTHVDYTSPPGWGLHEGYGYYFVHVASEINAAGEWAFVPSGEAAGRIYVYSVGTPTGTYEVSSRDGINITANYNRVKGIQITKANLYGVHITDADYCVVDSCTIPYAYYAAVMLDGSPGSDECQIINNTISWAGYYGVAQGFYINNTVISYNTITDTGCGSWSAGGQVAGAVGDDYTYYGNRLAGSMPPYANDSPGSGILTTFTSNTIRHIDNNTITRCAHKGIQTMHRGTGGTISRNVISYFMLSGRDGGGIYTYNGSTKSAGGTSNDEITDNFISYGYGCNKGFLGYTTTSYEQCYGIYMDNTTSDFNLRRNTISGMYDSGIFSLWGRTLSITDNVIYECQNGIEFASQIFATDEYCHDIVTTGNVIFCSGANQHTIHTTTYDVWDHWEDWGTSSGNYYFDVASDDAQHIYTWDRPTEVHYTLTEWIALGHTGMDEVGSVDWKAFKAAHTDEGSGTATLVTNPTAHRINTVLSKPYYGVDGVEYHGSITLAPWTSKVLIEQAIHATLTDEAGLDTIDDDAAHLAYNYVLGGNITLTGTHAGYASTGSPFTGTINGCGYAIAGLDTTDASNYQGLIQATNTGAYISNLTLTTPNVDGIGYSGAVVARMYAGTLDHCKVVGGTVDDTGGTCGGLVGYISTAAPVIQYCSSSAAVTAGGSGCGGLVAYNMGSIINSFASGAVVGTTKVGGLVGDLDPAGNIRNCYATGNVAGSSTYIGGLCGESSGIISNSYAIGTVGGAGSAFGGLIGNNDNPNLIRRCYWSTAGYTTSDGARLGSSEGFSSDCMTYPYTGFGNRKTLPYENWDIAKYISGQGSIWLHDTTNINNGYPILRWQR